ncbi:S-layer homology domain-containing protein [Aneurinibacillus aneurinilyticus]|uniref:S-layer homology domain-containing protein n=1 Tax=Aneurinibacillus aneurinilyticus TaxID=1391 RepID=UPI0023F2FBE3|nr:S-layer homology domain-containing protein [Aneurinibacillus aneurinilyticus]
MKRFIPLTLAGILSVTGLSLPSEAQAASQASFRDVAQSHWANQAVTKLALRDVIAGYEDGSFRPTETVTQLQAVVLAIRNMGLAEQSSLYKTRTIPYTVPEWAKGDIALAIEKGLLKPDEKNFSPDSPATRAWIAQLMVRMIGKESEANLLALQGGGTFTDEKDIPDWAASYVKAASKYELLTGYKEKNGYSFKPNRAVTRAEIAAMLSGSEKHLNIENDRMHTGYVQAMAGDKISMKRTSGQLATYSVTKDTIFYGNGKAADIGQVKPSARLFVIVEDGNLRYVEVLDGAETNRTISAEVEKAYPEEGMLVVKTVSGELLTYQLDKQTPVTSSTGTASSLKDLAKGDAILLTLSPEGSAVSITLVREGSDSEVQGTVHDLDMAGKLMMVKTASGAFKAVQFNTNTVLEYKGKRFPTLEDLRTGDSVQVQQKDGVATKIVVLEIKNDAGLNGTVKSVNTVERFVTVQDEKGAMQVYRVADNAAITIPGLTQPQLADIKVGDSIDMKFSNNLLSSLVVKNRTATPEASKDSALTGTVFAVDTKNRILSFKNTKGDLVAYEVRPDDEVSFIGEGVPNRRLTDIKTNMNITVQLDQNNKIIYVNADNRVRGQVTAINKDDRLLTVKLNTGETKVYIVDKNVNVIIYDERSRDIGDLRANDNVYMRLNSSNNNTVNKIEVERSYIYRVTNVNEGSNRFTGENDRGNSRYFYLDGSVTISVPGVTYPRIADVKTGDTVKVTYMGDTLKSLAVVPNTIGQVVSVNAEISKIRIKDYNGVTTEIAVPAGSSIKVNDRNYTSLTALQPGDRVQISEASNGLKNIVAMKKISTTFTQLDGSYRDRVYTAQGSYYIPDSLLARQPNLNQFLDSLKRGDKINVYLMDNQLFDIEKAN